MILMVLSTFLTSFSFLTSQSTDPFQGVFISADAKRDLQVELRLDEGIYKGSLRLDGVTYPATASKSKEGLRGTFQVGPDAFSFTMRTHGEEFVLESGGATYTLLSNKKRAENPLARKINAEPAKPSRAEEVSLPPLREGYTRFRHSLGMSFQYPSDWKLQEIAGGIAIIPPGVKQGASGPEEVYLVMASPAQGIEKADDPRLSRYLDQSVASLAPFLRRVGAPKPINLESRSAALHVWCGPSPLGFEALAESRVMIVERFAAGLFAAGPKDRIEARRDTLDIIFQTFAKGRPQTDPALIGTWYTKNYGRVSSSTGTLGSINTQVMVLRQDGSLVQDSETLFNAEHRTRSGSSSYAGDAASQSQGLWGVSEKKLTLLWPDGSYAVYRVHVQGHPGAREMLLTPVYGGEKELWTERND